MSITIQSIETSNLKHRVYESESYGTESYHLFNSFVGKRILATDGVMQLFADRSCYWIGDIVASYYPQIVANNEDFMTVNIVKSLEGDSCTFVITDGNETILIEQFIEYTDIDINVKMFLQLSEERSYVLMMPSEY